MGWKEHWPECLSSPTQLTLPGLSLLIHELGTVATPRGFLEIRGDPVLRTGGPGDSTERLFAYLPILSPAVSCTSIQPPAPLRQALGGSCLRPEPAWLQPHPDEGHELLWGPLPPHGPRTRTAAARSQRWRRKQPSWPSGLVGSCRGHPQGLGPGWGRKRPKSGQVQVSVQSRGVLGWRRRGCGPWGWLDWRPWTGERLGTPWGDAWVWA